MRPNLLLLLAQSKADLIGERYERLLEAAHRARTRSTAYNIHVECFGGEDGLCSPSLHVKHLALMRAFDGYEVLVVGGSVLNDEVDELLRAAPPDIEVENWATPDTELDRRVRYLFRSENANALHLDEAQAFA
jgi:hypothetical protein